VTRRFTLLLFAGLLAACANTPSVKADFDPATKFESYRTYTWLATPTGGSPLTMQRIVEGVDARLQAKGWRLAPNGDVRIAANVTAREKQDYTTYYNGMGYGWGWGPMSPGMATTTVYTYQVGTLVVDMFDAASKRAVWRGTADGILSDSPEKRAEMLQASLDKMFADFPPGGAR